MREIAADIWHFWERGQWIVITTNGGVRLDGACVMGRGVALQAAQRFPQLPYILGDRLHHSGNRVFTFDLYHLFTFPVKEKWWHTASLKLIEESARQLVQEVNARDLEVVYTVRPGVGNGRLSWTDVRPVLLSHFDDRFVVVEVNV